MEKEQLMKLIEETDNEKIIHYLYVMAKDFIERHSMQQIIAQSESKFLSDRQ